MLGFLWACCGAAFGRPWLTAAFRRGDQDVAGRSCNGVGVLSKALEINASSVLCSAMSTSVSADPVWFETAPDPIATLDAGGGLVWANAAFRAAFRHHVGPDRPVWGRWTPPPFKDGLRRFEAGAPDGRRFEWTQQQLAAGGSLLIARDVSERIAAAEDAARAKTLLFATLTHELRTPLNGILGLAELLGRADLEPAETDYLRAIRQSGEHLLELITDILDYSRLETGRLSLETVVFSPEDLIQSVAELLAPRAQEKGLEIVAAPGPGALSPVSGDDGRIRQILFNLAGNAIKFTEQGGVTLQASRRADGALRFTVKDTGPGIPLDHQERIFEEFAQADASIARRFGGAGLGLAIVRRLATAMRGRVGLQSQPGAGAMFWVDLPLLEARPNPLGADAMERSAEATEARVGVVSREAVLREGAASLLRAIQAKPLLFSDLPLTRSALDVALVDNALLSGLSNAAIEAFAAAAPPLILMIAPGDRGLIDHYRRLGIERYLIKPLRRRSLLEQILAAQGLVAPPSGGGSAAQDDRLSPHSLQGLSVLVAEDNPVNALLARTVLGRAGAQVTLAADGEEAVAAFRAQPSFDLVLLDLRMPRLDGLGAARRIRASGPEGAAATLIALTAEASPEDRAAALASGMNDFVTKPISPAALEALAGRYLSQNRLAG